nr:O-antigen ligase family protein [Vibrio tubiashii]
MYLLIFFFGYSFYPSFVAFILVIPLISYYLDKKYHKAAAIFCLILLSGKRGPLIAVVLAFSLHYIFLNLNYPVKLLRIFFFSLIMIIGSSLIIVNTDIPTFKKFHDIEVSDVNFLSKVTAGRDMEILDSIDKVSGDNNQLTGSGFSFKYELYDRIANVTEGRGYVHFSPFNYFLYFGVFFGVIYIISIYLYPLFFLSKSYVFGYSDSFFLLLFLCHLFNSLFSYTISQEAFFWISLGILCQKKMVEYK